MDVGLFDDVRAGNGRGLGDDDREAFYQLLARPGPGRSRDELRRGPGPRWTWCRC